MKSPIARKTVVKVTKPMGLWTQSETETSWFSAIPARLIVNVVVVHIFVNITCYDMIGEFDVSHAYACSNTRHPKTLSPMTLFFFSDGKNKITKRSHKGVQHLNNLE